MISVEALAHSYASADGTSIDAIAKVSFSADAGEFVSVVGPSGCGKSTLVKLIAGLIEIRHGRIVVSGETVSRPRTDVGIVFQSPVLLPWRTVLDNVLLPTEVHGRDPAAFRDRAEDLLRMVGLVEFKGRYPFELSGGMQQRVAISRALVCNPPILLMDEPFGALDAITREQLNVEMARIWRQTKKTVIFVTHSITEAVFLSTKIVVLSKRPASVVETIAVDLAKDDDFEATNSPEFGRLARHVRSLLR